MFSSKSPVHESPGKKIFFFQKTTQIIKYMYLYITWNGDGLQIALWLCIVLSWVLSPYCLLQDRIGFNLAGLQFLKRRIEEDQEVQFFMDATDRAREKRKKEKKRAILTIHTWIINSANEEVIYWFDCF